MHSSLFRSLLCGETEGTYLLLRFGVSNHLSIRDSQELLLTASSLKDPRDGLIDCAATPHGAVVPAAVIYGANASGKSNFVDAITTMRHMVLRSQTEGDPGGGVPRHPFRLDSGSSRRPSRFDIDFMLDGVRHHYGFEANDREFVSEWLYSFPKSHRRSLFVRDRDNYRFGRELKGKNSVIAGLTRPNSLYVSAAAQNRHKQQTKCTDTSFRFMASWAWALPVRKPQPGWSTKR